MSNALLSISSGKKIDTSSYSDRPQSLNLSSRTIFQVLPSNFWCIGLLASIFFCLALSGCGGAPVKASTSQGLVLSPGAITFGAVSIGQTADTNVSVVNQGQSSVVISKLYVTGQSFSLVESSKLPVTLAPGGALNFNVRFLPAIDGTIGGEVTIISSLPTAPMKTIGLSGVGKAAAPALITNASSIGFGNVTVNTQSVKSLTLSSVGGTPVTISAATLTGTGFAMSGATFPLTLGPGQTATVDLQFSPKTAGTATGQLTVASDSSTGATTVVGLSGTGTTTAPALNAITCSSSSMAGSGTDACSVTLSATAPSGGMSVSLYSSASAVTVPTSVTVPANAASVGFSANVSPVSSAQTAMLTAYAGSVSKTFALQLNAPTPTLTASTTSLVFGSVAVNT